MKQTVLFVALVALACSAFAAVCEGDCQQADENARMNEVMPLKIKEHLVCEGLGMCPTIVPSVTGERVRCVDGMAGEYECKGLDLMSFVSVSDLGSAQVGDASDIWGWTDPLTGREYAIVCVYDGTSFVDITDPLNPMVLAFIQSTSQIGSIWHDVKVFNNYAYIVSEEPNHGMQVFDLRRLRQLPKLFLNETRSLGSVPQLQPDKTYTQFGSAHNMVINEDTGYGYAVGTKTCNSGLHMVNLNNPDSPALLWFAGCYGDDGYVHDAQCVIYNGPDEKYQGNEICFCYDEDSFTIVDVTDKASPSMLARMPYQGSQYTHQGWLSHDQAFVLMNDELDEMFNANHHTRSMVVDIHSLDEPVLTGSFYSELTVIDHNLYIDDDGLAWEANYCGGLRVLDVSNMADPSSISEVMYFDVAPTCSAVVFQGAWSNYPYFPSGNVVINSIERGLFVVRKSDE